MKPEPVIPSLLMEVVNYYRVISGCDTSFDHLKKQAERYLKWCNKNEIPWKAFMDVRARLCKESGRRLPALGQFPSDVLLIDEAWAQIYDRVQRARQDSTFQKAELSKESPRLLQQKLAATPSQEAFKKQYSVSPHMCLAMNIWSGGFHPKSALCTWCALGVECSQKTNREARFDLIALRHAQGYVGYVKDE